MIMATSKDFQRIHKLYQEEGLPHGISIIRFCQQNGIVYKQYERWLKNRRKVAIHPVNLTNVPKHVNFPIEDEHEEGLFETPINESFEPVLSPAAKEKGSSPVLFYLKIVTNTGMMLQHRDLDYTRLLNLIQKLEGLC